tara:strand:+ start:20034 stop:20774 length:741 start_codon:yes stop_codon:yes gene_type:complete
MDDFLYVATSGARDALLAQAVNSNNLANVSTTGFKANLLLAESNYLTGQGQNSRVFGSITDSTVDYSAGVINSTGRELDVAIKGQGWIAVQGADGETGLTRRGDLRVNDLGQLTNGAGQQILGESGPIALPPFSDIGIGSDGTVSIVALGEAPNALNTVDKIKLINPDNSTLVKGEDGLMYLPEGAKAQSDPTVKVVSGSLESSNVNSVEAMVQMIELSRQYEQYVKMMETAKTLDQSSAELMSMS